MQNDFSSPLNSQIYGKNCVNLKFLKPEPTKNACFQSSLVLLEQPDNAADCIIKIDLGWRDNRFFIDESIFEQLFFVLNLADVLANPEKEVVFPMEYVKFGDLVKEMDDIVEACSHEDNVFASNEKYGVL